MRETNDQRRCKNHSELRQTLVKNLKHAYKPTLQDLEKWGPSTPASRQTNFTSLEANKGATILAAEKDQI
jgi:hypothetical protein